MSIEKRGNKFRVRLTNKGQQYEEHSHQQQKLGWLI